MESFKCPHCGKPIELSDALTHDIEEKVALDIRSKVKREIELESGTEIAELKKTLAEKEEKVSKMREAEIMLREEKRKLEDAKKDIELETQRRVDDAVRKIESDTEKRLTGELHLKLLEKDKTITDMAKMIEDLKRASRQGSMQTQGEVAELALEETLRKLFLTDEITEVKKGELGGDVRQVVKTSRGNSCGLILWERKRTKAWTEDWVKKLKDDMQRDKAAAGVIVTEVLPKDFKKPIGEKSGIWITTSEYVEPLATLLRKGLYDVAKEKAITANKQTKAEEVYDFVTSQEFVSQVERMVGIYQEMREQIGRERAVSERQWKMREMQVERLLSGVSGVYGSIQGIAGTALPQVKNLELE